MRSSLLKKICTVCFGLILSGLLERAAAQLSVGPSGLPVQTFDSAPAVSDISTRSVLPSSAGNITTGVQLDAAVQTNRASSIVTALPTSGTVPPGTSGNAQWNSAGQHLQTRPTGNSFTLLMATLRNDTGSNVSALTVSYNLGALVAAGSSIVEEVPGHRVYFSQTGATGTWVRIPEFDSAAAASAAPSSATLNLGNWAPSASLYLLWADDNAATSTTAPSQEGGYTIDDLAVTATPGQVAPFIVNQPLAQSLAPGSPASFSVTVAGTPPFFYQWLKNSNNIVDATNAIYTINSTVLGDQGFYAVLVTSAFGSVTSSNVFLAVACATPVSFITQPGNQSLNSGGTISLNSSNAGTQPIFYQWYRNELPLVGATNATYTKTNAQTSASGFYSVVASNCRGPVSSSAAFVGVAEPSVTLLGLTNTFWKYDQSGTDLGTAWKEPAFDDAIWPSGRGVLAVENNPLIASLTNTVLSLTNAGGSNTITFYFRAHFTLTNDVHTVVLVTSNIIDDGAVFYLNGVEFQRVNMGNGPVTFTTLAPAASAEGVFTNIVIPASLLVNGDNVLAVEVHQERFSNSDVVFASALRLDHYPPGPPVFLMQPADTGTSRGGSVVFTASVPSVEAIQFQWFHAGAILLDETNNTLLRANVRDYDAGEYFLRATNSYGAITSRVAYLSFIGGAEYLRLIEFTNLWRYDASGGILNGSWVSPSFDDTAWPAGRGVFAHSSNLRYPESTNTYLPLTNDLGMFINTFYFRTHFTIPSAITNLAKVYFVSSNLLDDAAVFYLNGVEVTNIRVRPGSIDSAPGNGLTYDVLQFPSTSFNPGDNVLAVSLFQVSSNSSDIVFGMNLRGYAAANFPPSVVVPLASQNKAEGEPVIFSANVFGSVPMCYQWFRDGSILLGATNAQLSLVEARPSNAGEYQFIASNLSGSLTSAVAALTVTTDLTPPTLVTAYVTNGQTGVVVIFSEPVTESSVTNLANYSLSSGAVVWSVQVIAPNQVLLQTSPLDVLLDYTLAVANIFDHADNPNMLAPGSSISLGPDRSALPTGLVNVQTVFVILMQNQPWSLVKNHPDCSYINALLPLASYCENHHSPNDQHSSAPNTLWLEAGTNFGNPSSPSTTRVATTNHLATQLHNAGIEWRGYAENMPADGSGTNDSTTYFARHNPFVYFDDVTTNLAYFTNHVLPLAYFADDLAAGRIGRYNFIVPSRTNSMYSLPEGVSTLQKAGDDFLAGLLPQILGSAAYSNHGALFIVWDEDQITLTSPVGMILLSPHAKGGGYVREAYSDHSSLLRTIQDIFGVRPYLGGAANVSPLSDLFQDLSLRIASSNGVAGVWLENVRPGRTNYVQSSSNLFHWTTISTNTATNAVFVPDPNAPGSPQRFYRALEQP